MRAVAIEKAGGPEVLRLVERPEPEPGAGQLQVRVRAFGINRADLLQRRGLYPAPPGVPADIPGLEYAGEIAAVGEGVTGWRPGDRVMGIVAGGAYAQMLVTRADHVLSIPSSLGFVEAAAVPEAFLTAHDALEQLEAGAGQWVLIHAVGSGVGTAALQLARGRGCRVAGTSRTAEKRRRAEAMGCELTVDSEDEGWADRLRAGTGGGVHAVIDLVGGPLLPPTLTAMARQGRLVLVGLTAGRSAELDLGVVLSRRLRIQGTVLRARDDVEKAAVTRRFREDALPELADGRLRPQVDRVLSLEDVPEAHRLMEKNANFGKLVIEV